MTQSGSPIELLFSDAWHALAPHLPLAREYAVGKYQLDFAYLPAKLNIELDGREFHTNPRNFTRDRRRDRELQALGWQVRRFSGYEVNRDVIACVREMVALIDPTYQISPERMDAWQRAHPRPARRPAPRSDVHPLRRDADRRTMPLPPYPVNLGRRTTSSTLSAPPPVAPAQTNQQRTGKYLRTVRDGLIGLPVLLVLLWVVVGSVRMVWNDVQARGASRAAAHANAQQTAESLAGGAGDASTALPTAPVAVTVKQVQSARLNLRAQPGANQPIITTLAQGTSVEALAETRTADGGVWVQVRSGRYEGWVNARFLK